MKVKLQLFLPMLAEVIGRDELEVEFDGSTVGDLLDHLVKSYGPRARKALLDEEGRLDMVVQVLVNRQTWVTQENLDQAIADGDQLTILVMMAGG